MPSWGSGLVAGRPAWIRSDGWYMHLGLYLACLAEHRVVWPDEDEAAAVAALQRWLDLLIADRPGEAADFNVHPPAGGPNRCDTVS